MKLSSEQHVSKREEGLIERYEGK